MRIKIMMIIICLLLLCGCVKDREVEDCQYYYDDMHYRQCVNCKESCENVNLFFGYVNFGLSRCNCLRDGEFVRFGDI